ncbi:MAG: hypothetical protein AAF558_15010, partial [Verrucomicrobiota bacterium]
MDVDAQLDIINEQIERSDLSPSDKAEARLRARNSITSQYLGGMVESDPAGVLAGLRSGEFDGVLTAGQMQDLSATATEVITGQFEAKRGDVLARYEADLEAYAATGRGAGENGAPLTSGDELQTFLGPQSIQNLRDEQGR